MDGLACGELMFRALSSAGHEAVRFELQHLRADPTERRASDLRPLALEGDRAGPVRMVDDAGRARGGVVAPAVALRLVQRVDETAVVPIRVVDG